MGGAKWTLDRAAHMDFGMLMLRTLDFIFRLNIVECWSLSSVLSDRLLTCLKLFAFVNMRLQGVQ